MIISELIKKTQLLQEQHKVVNFKGPKPNIVRKLTYWQNLNQWKILIEDTQVRKHIA